MGLAYLGAEANTFKSYSPSIKKELVSVSEKANSAKESTHIGLPSYLVRPTQLDIKKLKFIIHDSLIFKYA